MATETWGKHPDELEGRPFEPYMIWEVVALQLIKGEEMQKRMEDAK